MIKYGYTIGDTYTETSDINSIPEGVTYKTIDFEIDEIIQITEVPQEVPLWRIRTVLKLIGLEETIKTALNNLDEPTKTGALYIWEYGVTIERYSQTVLFLQSVLQMTNEDIDDVFIQAYNIQL